MKKNKMVLLCCIAMIFYSTTFCSFFENTGFFGNQQIKNNTPHFRHFLGEPTEKNGYVLKNFVYYPGLLFCVAYGSSLLTEKVRALLSKDNEYERALLCSLIIAKHFFDNMVFQSIDFLIKKFIISLKNFRKTSEEEVLPTEGVQWSLVGDEAVKRYMTSKALLLLYQLKLFSLIKTCVALQLFLVIGKILSLLPFLMCDG